MAGIVVGSVEVEVVPTTRAFSKLLGAQVKDLAGKIGDDLGRQVSEQISRSVAAGLVDGIDRGVPAAREKGRKAGDQTGGAFSDGFRRKVETALRSLPQVKITANSSDADLKLAAIRAELEALSKARIGVDIDETLALAQIDRLQAELARIGAESPSVQVRVDTAAASAELAAVRAQVDALDAADPTVDVTVDDHGGISALAAAGVALGPTLIPVAAAIAAAFAGIGAGIAVAVAGAGVAVLGLRGIGGAVKALGDAQSSAGKDAAQYAVRQSAVGGAAATLANAEANAADSRVRSAEQVANAQRGLATAQREAATTVRDAEQALADAQRQATQAQAALTQAREQARQQLQDLALQVADGALSQRQANLDLLRAKTQLDATLANPASTALQRDQARLTFDQAKQQITDLGVRQQRLVAQKTAADKAGIRGSQVVRTAEDQAGQARQRVAQAQQRLVTVQIQATERVAAAQRGIADAIRQQATAQRQSAASIASAARGLESARKGLGQSSASAIKLKTAMDGLTPAGRKFAVFLAGTLIPQLKSIQAAAASRLLPGLQRGLTAAAPALPVIRGAVGQVSGAVGTEVAKAGAAVGGPFWRDFFRTSGKFIAQAIPILGRVLGGFAKGTAGILKTIFPDMLRLGGAAVRVADSFARFGAQSSRPGGFQDFLRFARQAGPVVVATLLSLATTVVHLVQAFAPLGGATLLGLKLVADVLNRLPIGVVRDLGVAIGVTLLAVKAWTLGTKAWAVVAKIATGVTKAWAIVQAAFNLVMSLNPIVLVVLAIAGLVAIIILAYKHSDTFRRIVQTAFRAVQAAAAFAWNWIKKNWPLLLAVITGPIGVAVLIIVRHWDTIKRTAGALWEGLKSVFRLGVAAVVDVFLGMVGVIVHAAASAFGWVPKLGPKLKDAAKAFDEFRKRTNESLSGISDQKVTVTAELTAGRSVKAGFGVADGGVVRYFASGGAEQHVAQVAPAGSWRVWAEPETGGEAYIPLAPGKRPRSTRILRAVADSFGFGLTPMAAGGVLPRRFDVATRTPGQPVFEGVAKAFNAVYEKISTLGVGPQPSPAGGTGATTAPGAPTNVTGNAAIVKQVAATMFHWVGAQWNSLFRLVMGESGFRNTAQNPTSSAYGMFQFLNGTWAGVGGRKTSDPRLQAIFGGRYIERSYGDPVHAYSKWLSRSPHWYDHGGLLAPGYSLAYNGTGDVEHVLTADQMAAVGRGGRQVTYSNTFHYQQRPLTAGEVVQAQRQAEALIPAFA